MYYIYRLSTAQVARLYKCSEADVWNEIARHGDQYRRLSILKR